MSKLFEEDFDDVNFKTDNEYAKNYDNWRKKEELNKFKTKYGEDALNVGSDDSSSSSEDDEIGGEFTEDVERQFFKTLSCLKSKDPSIYDQSVKFFNENAAKPSNSKKSKSEQPMYLKDYERKLILEKGGQLSDSDDETAAPRSPTYVQEQKKIKENLKKALTDIDEEDGEWGGMFKVREKTKDEKHQEEEEYKKWLLGQKKHIDDKEAEVDLKPLKEYWSNPQLDDGEKFLRDYILKNRFLENEDDDYIPTYDEIVHDSDQGLSEDEDQIEKQEEFEHKYNYRFEEPDQEFIKRYPRTMENSLRRKDDKRKLKRAEVKERKQKEKEQKKEELKKMQELKHKEIEEKIQKLREITGNTEVAFEDEDIDGDFDPEAHDRRMQSLFNDEFYQGPEEEQKPEFPDIDEDLELENWDKWHGDDQNDVGEHDENEPHCEDDNFNMDCEYDPVSTQQELIENSKGKRKRRRKSKFAKIISEPKPVFDPNDKTYEQYLDEYYKFDCEDIIGDIPCRFKYRKVVPNSFGLTIEEILSAKDRELNKWCSIKKAVQYRPENVEKHDQIVYERKANNIELKKKLLPSLFETDNNVAKNETKPEVNQENKKKKKRRGKKGKQEPSEKEENNEVANETTATISATKNKKVKQEHIKNEAVETLEEEMVKEEPEEKVANESKEAEKPAKQKRKRRKRKSNGEVNDASGNQQIAKTESNLNVPTKNTKKRKIVENDGANASKKMKKEKRLLKNNKVPETLINISDLRLAAYGINSKKFKNKLKYGKQQ